MFDSLKLYYLKVRGTSAPLLGYVSLTSALLGANICFIYLNIS